VTLPKINVSKAKEVPIRSKQFAASMEATEESDRKILI
jgi:hypothetical protein